jgi:hypothetical protein
LIKKSQIQCRFTGGFPFTRTDKAVQFPLGAS